MGTVSKHMDMVDQKFGKNTFWSGVRGVSSIVERKQAPISIHWKIGNVRAIFYGLIVGIIVSLSAVIMLQQKYVSFQDEKIDYLKAQSYELLKMNTALCESVGEITKQREQLKNR